MRLVRLWVDGFKNLNNFEIDFESREGITVLIGNNGSGKSNILEAISAIFAGLYDNTLEQLKFKFDLTYQVTSDHELTQSLTGEKQKITVQVSKKQKVRFRITKENRTSPTEVSSEQVYKNMGGVPNNTIPYFFPSQVIALYSGEEKRLWNKYYSSFYLKHNADVIVNKTNIETKQRMLYVNKYYWDIALLTMIASDIDVSSIIGNIQLQSISIKINIANLTKFKSRGFNDVVSFVDNFFFDDSGERLDEKQEINFNRNKLTNRFDGETHRRLFNLLCVAKLPKDPKSKLITHLELKFNNGLTTQSFSEGEKKQILLKLILDVLSDQDALILFDEPDSHIHIANKKLIPEMLKEYGNKEIVLTTHSPTLAHSFNDKHLAYLNNGKINDNYSSQNELLSGLTGGLMGASEQQIFLESKKNLVLLVEGNTDKKHIETALEKLKGSYQKLDFDVFSMGGANNIKSFILGVKNSKIFSQEKQYIAIFDNDTEGRKCHNSVNGQIKRNGEFRSLLISDNIKDEIEQMYPEERQKEAYQSVIDTMQDSFNAENIAKKVKTSLSEGCQNFDVEDFDNFKKLFDEILDIEIKEC